MKITQTVKNWTKRKKIIVGTLTATSLATVIGLSVGIPLTMESIRVSQAKEAHRQEIDTYIKKEFAQMIIDYLNSAEVD